MQDGQRERVATVGPHRGAMALFIDGKVQPFTGFKITETPDLEVMLAAADAEIPGMAAQGVRLVWVPVFLDWRGPDDYDFAGFDKRVRRVLKHLDAAGKPGEEQAGVVIRLQATILTPAWYVDRFRDGEGRPTNLIEFRNPQGRVDDGDATVAISLGDAFWETFAVDCVRACVRHVRQSDYADRVVGWLPCAFNSNEWFMRCESPGTTHDFSRPTQAAFAAHLKESRGIDVGNPVPAPGDCYRPHRGEFLDTDSVEGPFIEEYAAWVSERMSRIILAWARAIREETADARKLVGFFYGYDCELSGAEQFQQCAHLALDRLLEAEEIDFFCSPCQYLYRGDESPVGFNSVLGSFSDSSALRGKLTYGEDDHRPPGVLSANHCLVTRDKFYDEMVFRRNFVQAMTHGQQQWWYSLGARWLDQPWRQAIAGGLHRLGLQALERDRSPVSEVAIVIDERSPLTMRINRDFQKSLILDTYARSFQSIGAPVELHELRTFLQCADIDRYRFVVFLNLFRVDDETMKAVGRLKGGGRTLFFQYAPGYLTGAPGERQFSDQRASDLVGMSLREVEEPMPMTVWIDPDSQNFLAELGDIRYGFHNYRNAVSPVLYAIDTEAEHLGRLHNELGGLAVKAHGQWRSVFSAAPEIPAAVVRKLLHRAGVHVYVDSEDVVYANQSYLGVSACSRGVKRIRLPASRSVTDALTGERIATDANHSWSVDMRRHEVRIFLME